MDKTTLGAMIQATKLKRQPYESELKDITKYFLPRRSNWENGQPGKADEVLWDSTGVRAVSLARNGIQGYMVNNTVPWFALQAPEELDDMNKDWYTAVLQTWQDHLYKVYARTNFYAQIGATLADGWAPGTATIAIREDIAQKRLTYHACHPKQIYIDEDENKDIAVVIREFTLPIKTVLEMWPGKAPEEMGQKSEKDPYEAEQITHVVMRNPKKGRTPWVSYWVLDRNGEIMAEKEIAINPYTVWRFDTNSDEIYARTPAHEVLAEVKILNQIAKTKLKHAQKTVDPAIWYNGEINGILDMNPGGINAIGGANPMVNTIPTGNGFPYAIEEQQEYQRAIRDAYMSDFFQMLQQAPAGMTATEVMERQGEKAAVLAAVTGRMMFELINPVIDKTLWMEFEAGRLPMPKDAQLPKGVTVVDILTTKKIEYTGMLPLLQKKHSSNQSTQQVLGMIAGMVQTMGPAILDYVDSDAWIQEVLKINGVPAGIIRAPKKVEKIRQQRAQEQQQQQQMAMQVEQMRNVDKMAKAQATQGEMAALGQAAAEMRGRT